MRENLALVIFVFARHFASVIATLPIWTQNHITNLHALKRVATPEELARSVLYLASDDSSAHTLTITVLNLLDHHVEAPAQSIDLRDVAGSMRCSSTRARGGRGGAEPNSGLVHHPKFQAIPKKICQGSI